ncbi:MAG: hypothetical protein QW478_15555 [Candidatus Micrarchaeaceae archaeon]
MEYPHYKIPASSICLRKISLGNIRCFRIESKFDYCFNQDRHPLVFLNPVERVRYIEKECESIDHDTMKEDVLKSAEI